ncbi:MAG: hypothetical protein ACJ764_05145 [Solirubrobacteraceae bacterium]
MIVYGLIGAKALYLLFLWLLSAAVGSWLTGRKGYGEKLGLAFGLLFSVIGLVLVLLLPGRPGSKWREEGRLPPSWHPRRWLPRRRRREEPAPSDPA